MSLQPGQRLGPYEILRYFFYHEGHPSTAVHRIVGKKLFEEIAARAPAAR